jgi:thioredoxin-related protein
MGKHFVCVEINASHQQSADELMRKKYGAEGGWPTVIVADPTGKKQHSVHSGYLPPDKFLEWLRTGV